MPTTFFFFNEDAKILDALRNGDESPLEQLFHQNRRPVASLVIKNHGTQDDAEDVLQEALVVLWERIRSGTFVHQAKLSTFIYATARNIWLRRLSRQRREFPATDDIVDTISDDSNPLDELEENEQIVAVRRAMEQLGNPCRDLLLLYYWEERSMEEIAVKLGFANADTAKSKKYQCKKSLESIVKRLLGGA